MKNVMQEVTESNFDDFTYDLGPGNYIIIKNSDIKDRVVQAMFSTEELFLKGLRAMESTPDIIATLAEIANDELNDIKDTIKEYNNIDNWVVAEGIDQVESDTEVFLQMYFTIAMLTDTMNLDNVVVKMLSKTKNEHGDWYYSIDIDSGLDSEEWWYSLLFSAALDHDCWLQSVPNRDHLTKQFVIKGLINRAIKGIESLKRVSEEKM